MLIALVLGEAMLLLLLTALEHIDHLERVGRAFKPWSISGSKLQRLLTP